MVSNNRSGLIGAPRRVLASPVAWRVTGWTYPTAMLATRGKILSVTSYLGSSKTQMEQLASLLTHGTRVLELGCGLGGNLLSIASLVEAGLGVDINPGYIRLARRLAAQLSIRNVEFAPSNLSQTRIREFRPSLVLSIGVFERLAATRVRDLLRDACAALAPEGKMALYFLSNRARSSTFSRLLGDENYVFWSESDARRLLRALNLEVERVFPWVAEPVRGTEIASSFGDMYVVRLGTS